MTGWTSNEQLPDYKPANVVSVGFLLAKRKAEYVLAATHDPGSEAFGGVREVWNNLITIPKGMVEKVVTIRKARGK